MNWIKNNINCLWEIEFFFVFKNDINAEEKNDGIGVTYDPFTIPFILPFVTLLLFKLIIRISSTPAVPCNAMV